MPAGRSVRIEWPIAASTTLGWLIDHKAASALAHAEDFTTNNTAVITHASASNRGRVWFLPGVATRSGAAGYSRNKSPLGAVCKFRNPTIGRPHYVNPEHSRA